MFSEDDTNPLWKKGSGQPSIMNSAALLEDEENNPTNSTRKFAAKLGPSKSTICRHLHLNIDYNLGKKLKNSGESRFYHIQHTVLILRLVIIICSGLWHIIFVVEVACLEFFSSKSKDWYLSGIQEITKRWLKTIEHNGMYFDIWYVFNKFL